MTALVIPFDGGQRPRLSGPLAIWFYIDSVPFNVSTIEGRTSLGGSESACIGTANALAAMGHDVHIFATKLTLPTGHLGEFAGVTWHPEEQLPQLMAFAAPDVFCCLRMPTPFVHMRSAAKLNLLWNQDMIQHVAQVAQALPQIDKLIYVSEYHREQWASVDKAILGGMDSWVTKNGFDHTLVPVWPETSGKELVAQPPTMADEKWQPRHPLQFCHISRPERGLDPLLAMWPAIRHSLPTAVLKVCRYSSMYDQGKGSWTDVCQSYDEKLAEVNAKVGGIEMVGELGKAALYDLLTHSSLMLYPGVPGFAETSCIAAIEAQACGCPILGSYKGALPETVGAGAGILFEGDAFSDEYQQEFVDHVVHLAQGTSVWKLSEMQAAGRAHVFPRYTFAAIASQWDRMLRQTFEQRYEANKIRVMRELLQHDNHGPALLVAEDIDQSFPVNLPDEVLAAAQRCDDVIKQRAQTSEDYATFSMDTEVEAAGSDRFKMVLDTMAGWLDSLQLPASTPVRLIDVACGNGAFTLAALRRFPNLFVQGWDYSAGVIEKAQKALAAAGFADRCRFEVGGWQQARPGRYDLLFCGEFLEHTEKPWEVVNALGQLIEPGGRCFMTMPHGPWSELMEHSTQLKRGHTHEFSMRDLQQLFGRKQDFGLEYQPVGITPRGHAVGTWHVSWQREHEVLIAAPGTDPGGHLKAIQTAMADRSAQPLDYWRTILVTRPNQKLVATMIVDDSALLWLRKCLDSIWAVVDHSWLYYTGHQPTIPQAFTDLTRDYPYVTVAMGAPVHADSGGFAGARNRCLDLARQHSNPDWVLWIDADEHMVGGQDLHHYLDAGGGPYKAFVIRQQHLCLDIPNFNDAPCRLIKVTGVEPPITFHGLIHEQPSQDPNDGIWPSLDYKQVHLVHLGYITAPTRQSKQTGRNWALLKAELSRAYGEPREIAYALYLRDLTSMASEHLTPDGLTFKGRQLCSLAVKVWKDKGFGAFDHKLHTLAWPFYQAALKMLGNSLVTEWTMATARHEFKGKVQTPERFYALTTEEAEAYIAHKAKGWYADLDQPEFMTTPWSQARAVDVPLPGGEA